MAKPPVLGRVKTRLATSVGDEEALRVYELMFARTVLVARSMPISKCIFYTEEPNSEAPFQYRIQSGDDLGERMHNAASEMFENGHSPVIFIGADSPDLTIEHLTRALEKLEDSHLVLGPSEDGGYYLLGMKNLADFVFDNKSWSTDKLLSETIGDALNRGLQVSLLDELNDIDTAEDLKASSWWEMNKEYNS